MKLGLLDHKIVLSLKISINLNGSNHGMFSYHNRLKLEMSNVLL